jgi:hypothetical protein
MKQQNKEKWQNRIRFLQQLLFRFFFLYSQYKMRDEFETRNDIIQRFSLSNSMPTQFEVNV